LPYKKFFSVVFIVNYPEAGFKRLSFFRFLRFGSMYKYPTALVVCLISFMLLAPDAHSQKNIHNKALPGSLSAAIAKAYPSAVLMWEIAPESGNRMGGQFSGVVVSPDGVILSAAHVVMPGRTYKVMFANGKTCVARGLGRITIPPSDMHPDAAMLKIADKGTWPFANMGWSSSLKIGQLCISIAYPESLEQRKPNVRFGKIAKLENEYGFLQSTCIMEPGDSGGPLFDLLGRVIGIHSAIQIPEDVNYEVPVNTYRKYWGALSQTQNYDALPADSGQIPKDTLQRQLATMPTVAAINSRLYKVAGKFKTTCLRIVSTAGGKEQQISGTLISLKGLLFSKSNMPEKVILSKSSMLGDSPVAVDGNGRKTKLSVIARSRAVDLVLLLPAKDIGKGIGLIFADADSISVSKLGTFLISLIPDSIAKAGVLGSLYVNLPPVTSYGYMGAATEVKNDKLVFKSVLPNSAAALAGLQAGDIIANVEGTELADELDFVKAIGKHRAGDTILLSITRTGENYTKAVALKFPPQKVFNHPAEFFSGGKSNRRDGFDRVLTQDATLKPSQCGGPVFDIDGNFAGINIARLSRTTTVIMPLDAIMQFISNAINKPMLSN
jgi:serine protease Do